jgi:hypothetical protein
VLGAFEHHVLEEVGEAGAPGALVQRADVVPQVDRDQRQPMIFPEDDLKSVRQRVLLILEIGNLERRRLRSRESRNRLAT